MQIEYNHAQVAKLNLKSCIGLITLFADEFFGVRSKRVHPTLVLKIISTNIHQT
jgi:hypothetical protein